MCCIIRIAYTNKRVGCDIFLLGFIIELRKWMPYCLWKEKRTSCAITECGELLVYRHLVYLIVECLTQHRTWIPQQKQRQQNEKKIHWEWRDCEEKSVHQLFALQFNGNICNIFPFLPVIFLLLLAQCFCFFFTWLFMLWAVLFRHSKSAVFGYTIGI